MSQYNVQGSTIGSVSVRPGETLLDACLRQGVALAFSCRGGTCHTCLMRCTAGTVPERAQRGLGAALQAKGYFLPCLCVPEGDLSVEPPLASDREVACRVDAVRRTAGQSVLVLEPASQIPLARGDAVALETGQPWACRANVVAVPEANYFLELALDASALAALRAAGCLKPDAWIRIHPVPSVVPGGPLLPTDVPAPPAAGASAAPAGPHRDPQLWAELENGRRVRAILDDFYARVFADARLAPYFRATTAHHVAGKQYAYLHKAMTGADVYFGDNPRNAHHTMVIDDDLFTHRQALMAQVLRAHGLSAAQIERWQAFEEPYRRDIVKASPVPRIEGGREVPLLSGFADEVLLEGSVCDHCGNAVPAGSRVRYHRRLGSISCADCQMLALRRANAAPAASPGAAPPEPPHHE